MDEKENTIVVDYVGVTTWHIDPVTASSERIQAFIEALGTFARQVNFPDIDIEMDFTNRNQDFITRMERLSESFYTDDHKPEQLPEVYRHGF